jgi:RNA polymerase sigma-70 factor (ECF subfamily)
VNTAPFNADTDPALLDAARGGRLAAQEQLFRQFQHAVWTLALRLTDQRADAEEVAQDAFLKALKGLPNYRGEAPFGMWLRQITVNEALMRRRAFKPVSELDEALTRAGDGQPSNTQLDLARSLQALPQPTRGVLWLYYVEGYTHPEIAQAYGQSVSFSKSQVARGAARLRAELGTAGDASNEVYA